MFGCEISSLEFELFSFPVRFGGLGILLPRLLANPLFAASRSATRAIVDSIRYVQGFELDVHDDLIVSAHRSYQQVCNDLYNDMFSTITFKLDPPHLRALQRSRTNDLSCWLSVMPIEKDNLILQLRNSEMLWPFDIRNRCLIFRHLVTVVFLPPAWTIFLSAGKVA